jgi:transglutaminase-like putative cysteine protease
MKRNAFAHLELVVADPAELVLSVAVAGSVASETLEIVHNSRQVEFREVLDQHGTRLHIARVDAGTVTIDYSVEVEGTLPTEPLNDLDPVRYLRPSRYCESDTLGPTARAEFAGLTGLDLLAGVSSWVGSHLSYVPGSSLPTDGAVRTLLSRQGVCRDYAHLVVALLRALDIPARLVAVYAPGLSPMDFHAVAEAFLIGRWHAVDATTLAPRQSLMRIATGRDASDTAFLSSQGGFVELTSLEVGAVVDVLPRDDSRSLVSLE